MKRVHTQGGYTLIESIIVVGLFAGASLAVMGTVLFLYRANANSIEQAFALSSARKGVEVMVRDIREAAYADDGSYPVVAMGTSTFTFYSDTDQDDNIERIRYFLQGEILYRGVIEPVAGVYDTGTETVSVVSSDVRNIDQSVDMFVYYDTSGVQITNYSSLVDVRFITTSMVVNVNPTRLPEEFTLQSSATMRNLKDNL